MAGEQKPKVKVFDCTGCGASITLRNPNSLSAACPTCHAVLDTTSESYRLLSVYQGMQTKFPRALAFGARGKLDGRLWEVIGHMVRRDAASGVRWSEYLLFSPYYGYRWLVEADGHWNFVTPIKQKPPLLPSMRDLSPNSTVNLEGQSYKIFNSGEAIVTYVDGEFYWKVMYGERVQAADYIAPPFMLSKEMSGQELVWSRARYLSREELKSAFKDVELPPEHGIGATQPSAARATFRGMVPYWIGFIVLLTVAQVVNAATSPNKQVYQQSYPFKANTKVENAITTPTFVLENAVGTVEIKFGSDTDNSWVYVSGELVNDKTGETYPFERTVEYYHGYSGGEYWSEGGSSTSLLISRVPSGLYYLNLDYQSGDYKRTSGNLSVSVTRGVAILSNYIWSLVLLSLVPCWYWLRAHSFEVARWSKSDFSPYVSSESSD